MADMGRPRLEHSKKKILSVRVSDSMYESLCSYAKEHNLSVTEVVLQELEKLLSKPE